MPPRRDSSELPQSCKRLKSLIINSGETVSKESIANVDQKIRNNAFSSLNDTLKSQANVLAFARIAKVGAAAEGRCPLRQRGEGAEGGERM